MKRCAAGTSSLNIEPNGRISPCCVISEMQGFKTDAQSIEENKFFESTMWKDVRNRGVDSDLCRYCKVQEASGAYSVRHTMNKLFHDEIKNSLRYLNVNLSNICNLQCVSCDSSRSFLKDPLRKIHNVNLEKIKALILANKEDLKLISIQGGEPLLYDGLSELISWIKIVNDKIFISVVSNINQLPNWFMSHLKNGDVGRVKVSIDAVGESAEVIRIGLNWNRFHKNLNSLIREVGLGKVKISTTVSVYSVFTLDKLSEYLENCGFNEIDINLVNHPVRLDIKNLSMENKEKILQKKLGLFEDVVKKHLKNQPSISDSDFLNLDEFVRF